MQASLFETTIIDQKNQPQNGLIISSKTKQPLNKQQQTFNRLVKKIEKLRLELERTVDDLDGKLNYYGKNIHPLEKVLTENRKEAVKLLFPFYTDKKLLSKPQKKILKQFLSMQLEEIFSIDMNKPDEELEEIFQKINGISSEEAATGEFEKLKDEMESMFESAGFDINLKDLDKHMSPEELMAKMKNLENEFIKQQENISSNKALRKKTAKQLEKEEKERQLEEARNKNISSIYKQLAKALHPDLEQDEIIKLEKEALMKRLTVAYNNNDLHSMLSLEMEWIHKEELNTDKLSNEKLTIYNRVLKEQVQDLEEQKFKLMEHPRFQPLMRYTNFFSSHRNINLPIEKRRIEETLASIKKSISNLKGKEALKEVKSIIQEIDSSNWHNDFLESMDFILK